jgi:hypothetical protein
MAVLRVHFLQAALNRATPAERYGKRMRQPHVVLLFLEHLRDQRRLPRFDLVVCP